MQLWHLSVCRAWQNQQPPCERSYRLVHGRNDSRTSCTLYRRTCKLFLFGSRARHRTCYPSKSFCRNGTGPCRIELVPVVSNMTRSQRSTISVQRIELTVSLFVHFPLIHQQSQDKSSNANKDPSP